MFNFGLRPKSFGTLIFLGPKYSKDPLFYLDPNLFLGTQKPIVELEFGPVQPQLVFIFYFHSYSLRGRGLNFYLEVSPLALKIATKTKIC